eukprot:TRINITY_DN47760_c0_g1_i1.p1 TRINITY_DN47760_c0_g1~~TRINITY_DN47760_c0_g1_i1.p1  ORF type:complete len:315 (+),score=51.57 TRINITY_DN47760_c0_g1_i1:48-992(+)
MSLNTEVATFSVKCEVGDESLHLDLTLGDPEDRQVQLLRHLSDACAAFHQELTSEEVPMAKLVEKWISDMARLKERVVEASCDHEQDGRHAQGHSSAKSTALQEAQHRVSTSASSQQAAVSESSVEHSAEQESEGQGMPGEDLPPPRRQLAFRQHNFDKVIGSLEEIGQESQGCEESEGEEEDEEISPPKRQLAMLRRDFETVARLDPSFRCFLEFARIAIISDDEEEHGPTSGQHRAQREAAQDGQHSSENQRDFRSVTPSMPSGRTSTVRQTKMPRQLWSALRAIWKGSRRAGHKQVHPEEAESQAVASREA